MPFNPVIHKFQSQLYSIIVYTTWTLYIIVALGLSAKAPEYLDTLQTFVKIYVSLFLIYRFNPFRRVKFTELDARISFSAGLFLITTTAIGQFLKNYLNNAISHK